MVVVFGASSGIGREAALRMAARGVLAMLAAKSREDGRASWAGAPRP